jgi:hypothetical protein
MCTADRGIVPWLYTKDGKHILPDFARPHQCHDFDSLLKWGKQREIRREDIPWQAGPGVQVFQADYFGIDTMPDDI